jgi:Siphovirus Gp157
MNNMQLYIIKQAYDSAIRRAEAQAEENQGELSEKLAKELDLLEGQLVEKIEACAMYYKNEVATAEMIENEINNLKERLQGHKNKIVSIKGYLRNFVPELQKYEFASSKISWRKSERVVVDNQADMPKEFLKIETSVKLSEVKNALKQGVSLPAHIEQLQNIQIS